MVLNQIAATGLTPAQKAVLVEAVQGMSAEIELIKLDVHQHPHGGGQNFTFTTMAL